MTNHTEAGARIVGTLRAEAGKGVVRMEDSYETDIDDLWSAVTDPSRLARWVAEVDGDLHVGGEFRARFTSGWDGTGRVEVCEPPRLLLVTLSPGQENTTAIEARLFADADQTRLVIEERGLPLDELAEHGAGWPRTLRISPRTSLDMRPWTGAGGGLSSPRPIVAWQTESRDARLRTKDPASA